MFEVEKTSPIFQHRKNKVFYGGEKIELVFSTWDNLLANFEVGGSSFRSVGSGCKSDFCMNEIH